MEKAEVFISEAGYGGIHPGYFAERCAAASWDIHFCRLQLKALL